MVVPKKIVKTPTRAKPKPKVTPKKRTAAKPKEKINITKSKRAPRRPPKEQRTGNPTEYTLQMATLICARLSEGESLSKICKDDKMPVSSTVYLWLTNSAAFSEMYARAKDESADRMVDDMLDIADNKAFDKDTAAAAKVQIDTRKWIASKLKPQKYGDKQQIEISGELKIQQMGDEELDGRLMNVLNRLTGGTVSGDAS